jgi:hypothetical protein
MPTDDLTTGSFPQTAPVDRSAAGISYQHYQVDALARGTNNGVGTRVAPSPDSLFSHPLSEGQFGGGTNAKMSMGSFTHVPPPPAPQGGV